MTTNTPTPAPDLDVRVAALMSKLFYYRYVPIEMVDEKREEIEQALRAELQKPALHEPVAVVKSYSESELTAVVTLTPRVNGLSPVDVGDALFLQGRAKPATVDSDDIYAEDKAVDSFASRMKWKLAKARERGKYGWQDKNWTPEEISQALREHVAKGDPVDVANYCMFLAARNEPITEPAQEEITDAERYRWIRELPNADSLNVRFCGSDLDNVVDAGIRASKGEKT